MSSTSGVKLNWPVVAIAFAVIGVPMAVAVIQDLGSDSDEEELLARIGEVDEIAAVTAPPDEEDDEAGRWEEPAMEQAFFDEVFLGGPEEKGPALRGEEPDLSRWPRAHIEREANEVTVVFPDDGTAERVLASRWGDPLRVVGDDDLARRIWGNAEARLRLVLESHDGEAHATFTPYVPAAEYVTDSGRFAFETQPILGATRDHLATVYGTALKMYPGGGSAEIDCPRAELSARPSFCMIWFAEGKAVKVVVAIDHSFDPQAGPQLYAALREALGPVREQTSDDTHNRWTFSDGFSLMQRVGLPVIVIERVAR